MERLNSSKMDVWANLYERDEREMWLKYFQLLKHKIVFPTNYKNRFRYI